MAKLWLNVLMITSLFTTLRATKIKEVISRMPDDVDNEDETRTADVEVQELQEQQRRDIPFWNDSRLCNYHECFKTLKTWPEVPYYLLNDGNFAVDWPTRYVRMLFIYNKNAFDKVFLGDRVAIENHAMEAVAILDKAYRTINFRVLLSGVEILDKYWPGEEENPHYYDYLKPNVSEYIWNDLRPVHKFDTATFITGPPYFHGTKATGAGMGDLCQMESVDNFPFIISGSTAITTGRPADYIDVLTHEMGHQFFVGHPYDPLDDGDSPCPTKKLFGSACTMGGNEYPKSLGQAFFDGIRENNFACLEKKPPQEEVYKCGNGILDHGEECDCGSDQNCLKSDPCCDGQICKLKHGAECSDGQTCCKNCKVDLQSCPVNPTITDKRVWAPFCHASADYTEITAPASGTIEPFAFGQVTPENTKIPGKMTPPNTVFSWLLHAPVGHTIKVHLMIPQMKSEYFDVWIGCPYDWLEVRDGGEVTSPLLGRYCTPLRDPVITSSTNKMILRFRSDSSFDSHFVVKYEFLSQVDTETATTCERDTLHLSCSAGKTLFIVEATYGRTSTSHFCPCSTCRDDCRADTSLAAVRAACQGSQQCTVAASNDVFGDPCHGVQKYLEVSYRCVTDETCQEGSGASYRGEWFTTVSGRRCQRWDSQTPHEHTRTPSNYPSAGLEENYCRNPDGEDAVWCYTSDPDQRWDWCPVPKCGGELEKIGQEVQNMDAGGLTCQEWSSQTPHVHTYTADNYPDANLTNNYCRNPNSGTDIRPWCYTTSAEERWNYCAIPKCPPTARASGLHRVRAASCAEVKSLQLADTDGEYTVYPFSTCTDVSIRVYCHNMASGNPQEFLSLPSGPESNYAMIFADRLTDAFGGECDGPLQNPYSSRAGTTTFSKVRIKFENSRIKVIRDDYTFARTIGDNNVSYAEAGDCYSWKQGCAKGTFQVNLTGTELELAPGVHWVMEERHPDYIAINDMFISEDRKPQRDVEAGADTAGLRTRTSCSLIPNAEVDVSIRVYCHNMASGTPQEFLSLPSGPESNYAMIFADRLTDAFGGECDGPLQNPYSSRAGTTTFSKVRIKFENSRIKVIRDDYTFAQTIGDNNVPYAEAGDCYSWKQGCAKGTFQVNLTGTELELAPGVHWVMEERHPDYIAINDMFISEDRKVATARCGGWCGHCWPEDKNLLLSHPQCERQTDSATASIALRCPHQDPPMNGALSCDTWLYGQFCTVQCEEPYDFSAEPARLYVCGANSEWRADPPGMATKWPDCTVTVADVQKGSEYQYYEGHCENEESRQTVKQNFIDHFGNTVFGKFGGCTGNANCTAANVQVFCGQLVAEEEAQWLFGGGGSTGLSSSGQNDANCGVPSVGLNARIIGGQYGSQGMFPWQVSLQNLAQGGSHGCGGSSVQQPVGHHCRTLRGRDIFPTVPTTPSPSINFVVRNRRNEMTNPGLWRVRVGLASLQYYENGEQEFSVSKIIMHPSYHASSAGFPRNDVALMKLSSPATVSNYVNNICLPDRDAAVGTSNCLVSGWGVYDIQSQYWGQAPLSATLKWTYAPILDPGYCSQNYIWGSEMVSSIMVCAGYDHGQDDACNGDSGGPFICPSPDGTRWELQGIVSWGEQPCGAQYKPSAYTRVTAFKSWIQQTIQSN
ncbi:hypothetical protein Bbelb_012200 [Branchiostoma belcheri]|nr:hypothetical protein Bbelb_012200 [Branchiostoma belcheri]